MKRRFVKICGLRHAAMALLILMTSLSSHSATTGELTKKLEPVYKRSKQRADLRRSVESEAYAVTNRLCFLFEFRKRHNLPLLTSSWLPNPNTELKLATTWMKEKVLRDSLLTWVAMSFENLRSTYGFDSDSVDRLSILGLYPKLLMSSAGYREALVGCSKRLGEDAEVLMGKEIYFRQKQTKYLSIVWIGASAAASVKLAAGVGAGRLILAASESVGLSRRVVNTAGSAILGTLVVGAFAQGVLDIVVANESMIEEASQLEVRGMDAIQILSSGDIQILMLMQNLARIRASLEAGKTDQLQSDIDALSVELVSAGLNNEIMSRRIQHFEELLNAHLKNPEVEIARLIASKSAGEKLADDETEFLNWATLAYAYRVALELTAAKTNR